MLKRLLHNTIKRAQKTFPAIVVTGPRQSGKTTLLREGWSDTHQYLSLENPDVRQRAIADPLAFLGACKGPVILDEIQYVTELLPYIKTMIDEDRVPGRWLLTGSQNFALMRGVSQSLAGRAAVLNLLPLSIAEAAQTGGAGNDLDDLLATIFSDKQPDKGKGISFSDWLLRGAFPEIRVNQEVDRRLWCASYIQTYLERDIRQQLNVGDLRGFDAFLRLAAARSGQVLNLTALANDSGVSAPTVKQWLSVLEASGIVFLLPPYYNNFSKRLIKSPKLYFLDTALATFLTGQHSEEVVLHGPMAGALAESAMVAAWVKAFAHRGEPPALYYWRSRDGLEVDLLIERNARLYPIEIKAARTIRPGHASALIKWRELAGPSAVPGIILCQVERKMPVAGGVMAAPWWMV